MSYKLFSEICEKNNIPSCLKDWIFENYLIREKMKNCITEFSEKVKIMENLKWQIEVNPEYPTMMADFMAKSWMDFYKEIMLHKTNFIF